MKLYPGISALVGAVVSALGQTIELGFPTDGTVLSPGQTFTSQVIQPESMASCIQVTIALAMNNCHSGVCPQPTDQLGTILYAGPWTATGESVGGIYQLQVPEDFSTGSAIFTLTYLYLLGGDPSPFLEFRNASLTIE